MKLKVPSIYGQRDQQWASQFIGYNTKLPFTIGQYGCLITSLAMYVNKKPNEVNDLLKENNGFVAGGGDFIWGKCTVLGLNETYLSPYYNSAVTNQGISKMKDLLNQGTPLVTHIDFDPSDPDDDQHWLLIIGYDDPEVFWAVDPWTAQTITLDVYGGVRRCVYQWHCYDKVLAKDEVVDYKAMYEKIMVGIDKLCQTLGISANMDVLQAETEKLIKLEDIISDKERLLTDAQGKIKTLQDKLDTISQDQLKLTAENGQLKTQIQTADQNIRIQTGKIETLSTEIKELSQTMTVDNTEGWQLIFLGIKKLFVRR